jgi:hypothetical protein
VAARLRLLAAGVAALALLAACGDTGGTTTAPAPRTASASASPTPTSTTAPVTGTDHHQRAAPPEPLRPGETRLRLRLPTAYTPSAPNGTGTDDYRCFLLDPHLAHDAFLTGTYVQPDDSAVVHHVILFRVPPDQVRAAERVDASDPGEGWTCFGDSGVPGANTLDSAPWLGAWAPGAKESVTPKGFGTPLAKGSRIVMQVHYNLLAGPGPDRSSTLLRLAPASADLTPLETMLLPAPVELPCRPQHADGPLCDRAASIADVKARFGEGPGSTNDLLYFLCGGTPHPSEVTSCTRRILQPTTVRAVAGHMHLLGRSITITVDPGTPKQRTLLHIPIWNFDDQGSRPIRPVTLQPGDTVKVTCRHVQWLRDRLPAFQGQPDRYVVWGEGTTDEMCLGILTVTRP